MAFVMETYLKVATEFFGVYQEAFSAHVLVFCGGGRQLSKQVFAALL